MTIKHKTRAISAEEVTTLFDIAVNRDGQNKITSIILTRRNFHSDTPAPQHDLLDYFYTKQQIDELIKIHLVIYESVDDFPETGRENYIYLVPFNSPTDTREGIYKEYRWIENPGQPGKYEPMGSTEIDLTDMQRISNLSTYFPSSDNNLSDSRYPSEKLVKNSLNTKVDKVQGKQLSTEDFTTALLNKLNGIEAGANKTIIDNALNSSSTNPVENRVINTELNKKVDKIAGKILTSNDFTDAYKNKLDSISTVGLTNDYNDLDNLPSIPHNTSDLNNDSGFITSAQAASQIGTVDTVQDGNMSPVSSNAVRDNAKDLIVEMTNSINDTVTYTIEDEEENVKADICEMIDTLTNIITGGV